MSMNVLEHVENFYRQYKGEKGIIGFSVLGRPIRYIAVEKTKSPTIIIQYSIHAREHVTALLGLEQIKRQMRYGKRGTVYFIPITNPDGVEIALTKKPLYKANARGVDLNVNFDARWGTGEQNVNVKGDQNYIGECPFSEPETKALRDFSILVKPDATVSYHAKGQEIYWQFFQDQTRIERDYKIAKAVSTVTGYPLKETPNSAGGYKDWCIESLSIPSLTIEVGNDNLSHPIGKEHLSEIFNQNKGVIKTLINKLWEQKCKTNL